MTGYWMPRFCFVFCAILVPVFVITPANAQAQNKKITEIQIPAPGPAEKPLGEEHDYSDSRSDLEVTIPPGWLVFELPQKQKTDPTMTMVEGPGAPAPSCRFTVRKPKQPDKITQAMINKIMFDKRNIDLITKNVGSGGRKVISVTKVANNGANGISARVVVPGTARRPDVTILVNFFEVVGRAYSFECSVLSADYDNMVGDIDAMIKSARFTKT